MTTHLYYNNPTDPNLQQILVTAKYLQLHLNIQ